MAEVRLTPSLPALTPAAPARANDAVRAAQRAFFDAALNASQTAPPVRAATTAAGPSSPAADSASPRPAAATAPTGGGGGRALRPGSLLDIRV